MGWILTWLNGAIAWIVLLAIYIVAGLIGRLILRKLRDRFNFRIPGLIRIYIGLGALLVILMIPGSLGLYYQNCLPPGTQMTEIISVDTANSIMNPTWEVLQQKLVELGGHCVANKLLGFDGKLIRFYQRTCGFGMALPDYAEINAQQTAQIIKLADQYTVLEVSCDSFSGAALP